MANLIATPLKALGPRPSHGMELNDDQYEKQTRATHRQLACMKRVETYRKATSTPISQVKGDALPSAGRPNATPPTSSTKANKRHHAARSESSTPIKRIPLLANFEEWMRMATDNKINANNSWNFALIDYFHEMSLLKEGDGVNFQKASCTLDGCVKIYTSRVDSVASETGKLLSGLATGNTSDRARESKNGDLASPDDRQDESDEERFKAKNRRMAHRISQATLASTFNAISLRRLELEFTVDPLFKKASADFDEGGAKGLLLNHLNINSRGRIMFDSCDECEHSPQIKPNDPPVQSESAISIPDTHSQDASSLSKQKLSALQKKYLPNLDRIGSQSLCRMPTFLVNEPSNSVNTNETQRLDSRGRPSAQAGIELNESSVFLDGDEAPLFASQDQNVFGPETDRMAGDFGTGGEAWIQSSLEIPPQEQDSQATPRCDRVINAEHQSRQNLFESVHFSPTTRNANDIFKYFDSRLNKEWAGPEHWRITKVKDGVSQNLARPLKRNQRENFSIQFEASSHNFKQTLTQQCKSVSKDSLALPRSQRCTRSRNLLPDDKHFKSTQLLRYFLNPRAKEIWPIAVSDQQEHGTHNRSSPLEEGEAAFAEGTINRSTPLDSASQTHFATYDPNFFHEDLNDTENLAIVDREDAPMELGPDQPDECGPNEKSIENSQFAFGSHLVSQAGRRRADYVQYAKFAKRVDVRKLKEEMWKGINESTKSNTASDARHAIGGQVPLKFTEVMQNLLQSYPDNTSEQISTSYCFISLLHLANEKSLAIESATDLQDLNILHESAITAL